MNTLETHTFDTEKRIFIPHDTLCASCDNIADNSKMYEAKLYRTVSRANIIIASSVTFNVLKIGIPRCTKCARFHEYRKAIEVLLFFILGIVSIFIVSAICKGNMEDGAYIFFIMPLSIIGGLVITIIGGIKLAELFIKFQGVVPEIELKKNDLLILKLMGQGWDLMKPSAK